MKFMEVLELMNEDRTKRFVSIDPSTGEIYMVKDKGGVLAVTDHNDGYSDFYFDLFDYEWHEVIRCYE